MKKIFLLYSAIFVSIASAQVGVQLNEVTRTITNLSHKVQRYYAGSSSITGPQHSSQKPNVPEHKPPVPAQPTSPKTPIIIQPSQPSQNIQVPIIKNTPSRPIDEPKKPSEHIKIYVSLKDSPLDTLIELNDKIFLTQLPITSSEFVAKIDNLNTIMSDALKERQTTPVVLLLFDFRKQGKSAFANGRLFWHVRGYVPIYLSKETIYSDTKALDDAYIKNKNNSLETFENLDIGFFKSDDQPDEQLSYLSNITNLYVEVYKNDRLQNTLEFAFRKKNESDLITDPYQFVLLKKNY